MGSFGTAAIASFGVHEIGFPGDIPNNFASADGGMDSTETRDG
jgi:hypothetical protein